MEVFLVYCSRFLEECTSFPNKNFIFDQSFLGQLYDIVFRSDSFKIKSLVCIESRQIYLGSRS